MILDTDLIYDVLVEECGAHDSGDKRREFAFHFPACREFRFQGALGLGGKVWAEHHINVGEISTTWKFTVTCYSEDGTPERRAMIERANARLAAGAVSMDQKPPIAEVKEELRKEFFERAGNGTGLPAGMVLIQEDGEVVRVEKVSKEEILETLRTCQTTNPSRAQVLIENYIVLRRQP